MSLTELHDGENDEDDDFLVLEGAPLHAELPQLEGNHEHQHTEVHERDQDEEHDSVPQTQTWLDSYEIDALTHSTKLFPRRVHHWCRAR